MAIRDSAILGGILAAAVCGPDLDFVPHLLMNGPEMLRHGGATHSFVAGIIAATCLTSAAKLLVGSSSLRVWCVACLGWWSHVTLDFFTAGSRVMALWPLTEERFGAPIPLFIGAEHSQLFAIHLHVITLVSEIPFVVLMWWMGRSVARRRANRTEKNRARRALAASKDQGKCEGCDKVMFKEADEDSPPGPGKFGSPPRTRTGT